MSHLSCGTISCRTPTVIFNTCFCPFLSSDASDITQVENVIFDCQDIQDCGIYKFMVKNPISGEDFHIDPINVVNSTPDFFQLFTGVIFYFLRTDNNPFIFVDCDGSDDHSKDVIVCVPTPLLGSGIPCEGLTKCSPSYNCYPGPGYMINGLCTAGYCSGVSFHQINCGG